MWEDDYNKITLVKVGSLKHDRIKSISMFHKELNCYTGHSIGLKETKDLLDLILSGNYQDAFGFRFRYVLDLIFDDNEYFTVETYGSPEEPPFDSFPHDRTDEEIDEFVDTLINYYSDIPVGEIDDNHIIKMREIARTFLKPQVVWASPRG